MKGKRVRVMVVEDSKVMRQQLEDLLIDTGFEIAAECKNGTDALLEFEASKPDVVTMDIVMPGMDGLEAAQNLLNAHPNARIVIISSLMHDETIESAQKIGVKGFLSKPLERDQVVSTLEQAMKD